jgi:subtilisin family serine protease
MARSIGRSRSVRRDGWHRERFAVEGLEDRALPSAIAPRLSPVLAVPAPALVAEVGPAPGGATDDLRAHAINLGDSYRAGDQTVSLLRVVDEWVVGLEPGADAGILDALTAPGGGLSGFVRDYDLNATTRLFAWPDHGPAPADVVDTGSIAALPGVAWIAPSFVAAETATRMVITNELVVDLRDGVAPEALFGGPQYAGYSRILGTPDQYVVALSAGAGAAVLNAAARLGNDARVDFASPNFYQDFRVHGDPNDPLYGNQWHLKNTGQTGALADADVDADLAWDTTTGRSDLVVAIIDNGVQLDHPDLAANLFVNPGEIAGNGIDDDGNGWVDDVSGWDFADNDNNPSPATVFDNHGTPVAGVAAAVGNNALGVTGASQHARILPVKIAKDTVGNGGGFIPSAAIATAIYYAAGRTADGTGTWDAADILNNSWGGGLPDATLTAAFNWANANGRDGKGAPTFASAGNSASDFLNFTLSGVTPGNWIFEWRYVKNASGSGGGDTVWLDNVRFPDGSRERFDAAGPGLPAGWSTSGNANWTVVDDPAHTHGTGRYAARAGTIGNSQTTTLRSPTITVGATSSLLFNAWVSSAADDVLAVYASNDGGATFFGPFFNTSRNVGVISNASYPASLASTIAVGASTDWDYRSHYAQYGPNLDFVAPSNGGDAGITATDRTGAAGYNTAAGAAGDYTSTPASAFGGTSSASPLAAGIAALILSKNPNLTSAQVRQLMRDTAEKIGGVTYDGSGFNNFYGYGRINAHAALAGISDPPSEPDLDLNSDTGVSASDDLTNRDNSSAGKTLDFTVSGTSAGATVNLYADGNPIGSAVAAGSSVVITTDGSFDLLDGSHAITAGQTAAGKLPSAASLGLTITVDTAAPSVTQYQVLFGSQSYNLIGSARNRLPWRISGIRAVSDEAIALGSINSLTGLAATSFAGLGTTSLTWGITPITDGSFATTLAGTGANALQDAAGNGLKGGDFVQNFRVLHGDVNDNGYVSSADMVAVQVAMLGPYNIFADLNGDGVVNRADVLIARSRIGKILV